MIGKEVITTCSECKFVSIEFEQKICRLIEFLNTKWIDKIGFDELYECDIHPQSCPLKEKQFI